MLVPLATYASGVFLLLGKTVLALLAVEPLFGG
jgi:hypothetical protein